MHLQHQFPLQQIYYLQTPILHLHIQVQAYNGRLTKNNLMGLMVTDVAKYKRGYLLPEELELQYQYALSIKFDEKKYNQIEYLIGFLN